MLDVHSSPHRHETQFSNAAALEQQQQSVCAMGGKKTNVTNLITSTSVKLLLHWPDRPSAQRTQRQIISP